MSYLCLSHRADYKLKYLAEKMTRLCVGLLVKRRSHTKASVHA